MIALAGNPNCGKTSIFNLLTKTRQHVGNWPGVTVEKKEGILKYKDNDYQIVDLPGIYSLGACSEDEIVARNFIIDEKPDLIINVVDATNIERSLYLTLQLLELGLEVIIALNMIDEAEIRGIEIFEEILSKTLKVRVIKTSALKNQGIDLLIEEVTKDIVKDSEKFHLDYGNDLEKYIEKVKVLIKSNSIKLNYDLKWTAVKLIENDEYIKGEITKASDEVFLESLEKILLNVEENIGYDGEVAVVDRCYEIIEEIVGESVVKKEIKKNSIGEKIDKLVTNKYLGIPIFLIIMFLLYEITFSLGSFLQKYTEKIIGLFSDKIMVFLESLSLNQLVLSFFDHAIFGAIATILSFLPLIMVMYLLIGLLEDSGYMARAAYVMDKMMRKFGLHGKTFVSMIISLGCNVPGIMATRTLNNKKDRMIAILINPFMSCGARLPIYVLFISAFFKENQALILLSLYSLGILVAIIAGKIFSKTIFKGESSYFIMELPSYKIPSAKNILLLMWDKASSFVKRAGILILPIMIVLWFLSIMPLGVEPYSEHSYLGMIGGVIAPILSGTGFGNWQSAVALITGLLAKETVIATMGFVYLGAANGGNLIEVIRTVFTPLSALSFMVMSLLYTPCIVTLGTIKKETNSIKWTIFSAMYSFLTALALSTLVYQVGRLLGFS
ncbi:MAG: ferrous iron transport protein B [Sarcina sp.]